MCAQAVAAIDSGDAPTLDALLDAHPRLVTDRIPNGEQGYFADPYLLWFVAENPIRHRRLPANIVAAAMVICDHLDRLVPVSRQHQLDYAVMLVATGLVPRECGVQIALIDALVARGGAPEGIDAAVAHGEDEAARRLLHHGAPLTLAAAVCLGMTGEAARLLSASGPEARADALTVAAARGLRDDVRMLIADGVDPNLRSRHIHPHATALHQAALAGDTQLCQLLLDGGASRTVKDDVWRGTPADWADHAGHRELARLLREGG